MESKLSLQGAAARADADGDEFPERYLQHSRIASGVPSVASGIPSFASGNSKLCLRHSLHASGSSYLPQEITQEESTTQVRCSWTIPAMEAISDVD
jgi:hypothetical protein